MNMKLCECGCGESIAKFDLKGRERRYKVGHQSIVKIKNYKLPSSKICNKCKIDKDISEFSFRNYKAYNGLYYQRPRSKCKLCESRLTSNWQKLPEIRKRRCEQKRADTSLRSLIQNRLASWRNKTPNSDLTTEYLLEQYNKQNGKCYYTNDPLKVLKGKEWKDKFENSISLDRLDPSKGYIKGNVVFCTYSVNTMKGKLTEQEFYSKIKKILTFQSRFRQ